MRKVQILAVLLLSLLFVVPRAGARRRRKKKYTLRGLVRAPGDRSHCRTPAFAYWVFTVPNVTPPPCRPRLVDYLVTGDEWDGKVAEGMLRKLGAGGIEVKIHGVRFEPRVLVVPKDAQSYEVTFQNRDRFFHEVLAPGNKVSSLAVPPMGSATLEFPDLPPLGTGEVRWFRLGDRWFPHMRGAVVFVRSTALAVPDPAGRFSLRLAPGDHVLRLWHRGRLVAKRKVTVRRRTKPVIFEVGPKAQKARPKERTAPRQPRRRRRRRRHRR